MTNLQERIQNKSAQCAKIKNRLMVYLKDCSESERDAIIFFVETGDRTMYKDYLKSIGQSWGGDAWHKANELYDAQATLAKYEKQLQAEESKNRTINEMPEVLVKFRDQLIDRWDKYDEWKKATIREEYKSEPSFRADNYREWQYEMRQKWGAGWYEFIYKTTEQIHKSNVKDAETLVLNLINRTVELVGKITDCKCLRLSRDNSGYSIINGEIIGENGKCRVESIGAGGYNIQRYHIRVLVHKIK